MKYPFLNIEGVVKAYSQQDYQRTLVILTLVESLRILDAAAIRLLSHAFVSFF